MSWWGRTTTPALVPTGIRYTVKIVGVTAGGTATFQTKRGGRHRLHTAAIYPKTDTNAQPCWIGVRRVTGDGTDQIIHFESGWATNARIFSLSRPVDFEGPAYCVLYYGGDTTQNVEFSVGVEAL